jgi:hypothetical protein
MIVFAADHGVAPLPEVSAGRKMPGGRISFSAVSDSIQQSLSTNFGDGKWIVSTPEDSVYLNWDLIQSKKLNSGEVTAEAVQAVSTNYLIYFGSSPGSNS